MSRNGVSGSGSQDASQYLRGQLPNKEMQGEDKKTQDRNKGTRDSSSASSVADVEGADGNNKIASVGARQQGGGQQGSGGDDKNPSELMKTQISITSIKKTDATSASLKEKMSTKYGKATAGGSHSSGASLTGDIVTLGAPSAMLLALPGVRQSDDVAYHPSGGGGGDNASLSPEDLMTDAPGSFRAMFANPGTGPGLELPPGGGGLDLDQNPTSPSGGSGESMIATKGNPAYFAATILMKNAQTMRKFVMNQIDSDNKMQTEQSKFTNQYSSISTVLAGQQLQEGEQSASHIESEAKLEQAMALINTILTVVTLGLSAVATGGIETAVQEAVEEAVEEAVTDAVDEAVGKATSEATEEATQQAAKQGSEEASSTTTSAEGSGNSSDSMNEEENVEDADAGSRAQSQSEMAMDDDLQQESAQERDSSQQDVEKAERDADKQVRQEEAHSRGEDGKTDNSRSKLDKATRGLRIISSLTNMSLGLVDSSITSEQSKTQKEQGETSGAQSTTGNAMKSNEQTQDSIQKLSSEMVKDLTQTQAAIIKAMSGMSSFNIGES